MLKAVYLPDLLGENRFHEPEPLNSEEALESVNDFLAELDSLGATIVAVIPVQVKVTIKSVPGVVGGESQVVKQVFIIKVRD